MCECLGVARGGWSGLELTDTLHSCKVSVPICGNLHQTSFFAKIVSLGDQRLFPGLNLSLQWRSAFERCTRRSHESGGDCLALIDLVYCMFGPD